MHLLMIWLIEMVKLHWRTNLEKRQKYLISRVVVIMRFGQKQKVKSIESIKFLNALFSNFICFYITLRFNMLSRFLPTLEFKFKFRFCLDLAVTALIIVLCVSYYCE